ncbi:MAG: hypothetical protein K2W96_18045, partial [Gemmataceae bacterium]|nr:hypothetical protein [Gemmataceae bacterium]
MAPIPDSRAKPRAGGLLAWLAGFWRRPAPEPFVLPPMTQERLDEMLLWTLQHAWPALTSLARSGLRDTGALRRLRSCLARQERDSWLGVVEEAERLRRSLARVPDALPGVSFVRLIRLLNDRWFIPRGLLVACVPLDHRSGLADLSRLLRLEACLIHEWGNEGFQGGAVPVFLVSVAFPRPLPGPTIDNASKNYFDPMSAWVRLDTEVLRD